jgi:hypothetical protein
LAAPEGRGHRAIDGGVELAWLGLARDPEAEHGDDDNARG